MRRILEPQQIESAGKRSLQRVRLPDPAHLFARRARRLHQLSGGHALGDYLQLMGDLAQAQQAALAVAQAAGPDSARLARAPTHGLPPLCAAGWPRADGWQRLLASLCAAVLAGRERPGSVREVCNRLCCASSVWIEDQADTLLAPTPERVDVAAAPFVMAALQVYWLAMTSRLSAEDVAGLDAAGPARAGVCPVCGTPPVASIVHADERSEGARYLHCALCASEWHAVRATCSHCQATRDIAYHSIEGAGDAVRAESCEHCHVYRKILDQERGASVEPVADDLASLSLDLLMTQAGYHRSSGNPLLWHSA
jgi:FdhE protein